MFFPVSYSDLRGFNYVPSYARNDIEFWRDYDGALIERELCYAQRLGLNSARVFLSYAVYEHDRAAFLARVKHFVRAGHARSISTMIVLFDSCFDAEITPKYDADYSGWICNPGVDRLSPDFWPSAETYCADLVDALADEPGLLIWDVMNEPTCTSWLSTADEAERNRRTSVIWDFVRHHCQVMHRLDPAHPLTVGVMFPDRLPNVADCVDVVSFHDYSPTRARIRSRLGEVIEVARQQGKPVLVSEVGCLARANPYDVCLEICRDLGIGWYLWELMIGKSRWRDIHGIVYPDGTVRDPSVVAAVQGFFRNRGVPRVAVDIDKEGRVTATLRAASDWLATPDGKHDRASCAAGLETLECLANLLETGELVYMADLPSVQVEALRAEPQPSPAAIRAQMQAWVQVITPYAQPAKG